MTSVLDDSVFVVNLIRHVGVSRLVDISASCADENTAITFSGGGSVRVALNPDNDLTVNGKACLAKDLVERIREALG